MKWSSIYILQGRQSQNDHHHHQSDHQYTSWTKQKSHHYHQFWHENYQGRLCYKGGHWATSGHIQTHHRHHYHHRHRHRHHHHSFDIKIIINSYCNLQGGRCDRGGYRATLGPVKPHSVNIALCVSQQPESKKPIAGQILFQIGEILFSHLKYGKKAALCLGDASLRPLLSSIIWAGLKFQICGITESHLTWDWPKPYFAKQFHCGSQCTDRAWSSHNPCISLQAGLHFWLNS